MTAVVHALAGHVSPDQERADIVAALEEVLELARAGSLRAVAVVYVLDDNRFDKACAGRYSDLLSGLMTAQWDLMKEFRE